MGSVQSVRDNDVAKVGKKKKKGDVRGTNKIKKVGRSTRAGSSNLT